VTQEENESYKSICYVYLDVIVQRQKKSLLNQACIPMHTWLLYFIYIAKESTTGSCEQIFLGSRQRVTDLAIGTIRTRILVAFKLLFQSPTSSTTPTLPHLTLLFHP
jgi:hypothetical protein